MMPVNENNEVIDNFPSLDEFQYLRISNTDLYFLLKNMLYEFVGIHRDDLNTAERNVIHRINDFLERHN